MKNKGNRLIVKDFKRDFKVDYLFDIIHGIGLGICLYKDEVGDRNEIVFGIFIPFIAVSVKLSYNKK